MPFVAQLRFQMINLQLHDSDILLMRKVAPALRLAPTSMGGIHTKITTALKIPIDGANCKDAIELSSPKDV